MKKIYTSIDLGSDTIKIIVGESYNGKMNVLASHAIKSKGIRKGLIVDPNLAVTSIKDGIREINEKLNINITKVIVNVPDYNSKFMFVTGKINIEHDDGIIKTEDINKVIKNSVYSKLAQEYELVTVIPIDYIVDDVPGISKPVGIDGKKLEIKGIMVSTPKKNIYSVISVIEGAGLEVVDITFSGIADYFEVKNNHTDKLVGAIINIGHETTNVSIINKGKFMNTETLQLGGINIEKDLAYVFGINIFDARVIKEKFASSHKRFIALNEEYEIKNNAGELIKLNQIEVSEIVMSRLSEILEYAKKQILLLTNQKIGYIIITGGLTEIRAFKNLVVEIFSKDVIIYTTTTLGLRDNMWTSALGMLKYFDDKMESRGKEYSMISSEEEEEMMFPSGTRKDKLKFPKFFGSLVNKEEK